MRPLLFSIALIILLNENIFMTLMSVGKAIHHNAVARFCRKYYLTYFRVHINALFSWYVTCCPIIHVSYSRVCSSCSLYILHHLIYHLLRLSFYRELLAHSSSIVRQRIATSLLFVNYFYLIDAKWQYAFYIVS